MHIKSPLKLLACIFILLITIGLFVTSVAAQTYSYSVPETYVDVYWNADGSSSILYDFTFQNSPSGAPIDFLDVGIPNNNYNPKDIQATVDGKVITDVTRSDYIAIGAALGLGANAIQPGQQAQVKVWIPRVTGVLYPDSTNSSDASAEFGTNYFETVSGTTDFRVTFHLPPGVQPNEPRWHTAPAGFSAQPEAAVDDKGNIMYSWHDPSANSGQQYMFGASFPAKYVPADTIVKESAPSTSGSTTTNFFAGCSSFLFPLLCIGGVIAVIGFGAYSSSHRKLQYLPPKVSIEGHGIKRGLTAVEAAILMEQPMDKIMTMILFGVIKKNAAEVISRDPLKIKQIDFLPSDLNMYEVDFLAAFENEDNVARRRALQSMMVDLVKSVGEKMKGFSLKETVAYYQEIVKRAWTQVEGASTPEVKSQLYDENLEWTMLDKDYDGRTKEVFGSGPVFVPIWWPHYSPGFGGGTGTPAVPSVSKPSIPGGLSRPTLPGSEFAASMVAGVQTFSSKVVGNITDFTSNISRVTNPPPPMPTSSSRTWGGGGGGHSCACACACAGCACACAGGGR